MKKYILLLFLSIQVAYSQSLIDTIYTIENNTIKCKLAEIGEFEIKYKKEGEDFIRNISKNLVSKIGFKNGLQEKFSVFSESEIVKSGKDWEKVKIFINPNEVIGLNKIDLVSSKAKATTSIFTGYEKIANRAYSKLQITTPL